MAGALLGLVVAGAGRAGAEPAWIRDAGPLAGSVPIRVGFVLTGRHADELERDVALVSSKGSLQYRHFLSNAQWNAYFAPSEQTVQSVAVALRRAGFTIRSVASNRGMIEAEAPSGAVARYFSTTFRRAIEDGSSGLRYRNATPARIPGELRAAVAAVVGLDDIDNVHLARPQTLSRPAGAFDIGGPILGPDKGYGPAVFATGYDYPVRHGYDGSGGTVGITIPDDYLDSDTAAYLAFFRIKQTGTVRRIPVDGGYIGPPQGEATLDVETISALAPGANIDAYEFPPTTRGILDTFNQIVADNVVDAFSNSWGGCEITEPALAREAEKTMFEQAALKGITVISMSGNSGAYGCYKRPAVEADASNPYDTAVGGVHVDVHPRTGAFLSTLGTWSVALTKGPYGSGGGVSREWPLPSYQRKVAVDTSGRNVPDLALAGDIEDSWYFKGCWCGPIGGTDWAAPAFNAMLEETNQVIGHENGVRILRAGFVNPSLYAAYGAVGERAFTDVTQGSNGVPKIGPGYNAGAGYDLVTGLGTPVGMGLAEYL